jgi:hypothetical protein
MNEIVWILDKVFEDSNGNSIHILQRILPDLVEAKNEELLPFFYEPSLFQVSSRITDEPKLMAGVLTSLNCEGGRLDIGIRPANSMVDEKWSVDLVREVKMTVWRINNLLDTLQINIAGEQALYMQTGGTTLTRIFDAESTQSEPNENIVLVERIFVENASPQSI